VAKKYKIKTHSGAKRRFYVSGAGKILRRKHHINNSRRKKRPATLRMFDGKLPVAKGDAARIRKLMPYHT
jgi:large subunit ribosomal protein L35